MLLVRDHPDWSDRRIAKEVSKDPSTLSCSREYKAAAAMACGKKGDLPRRHIEIHPQTGLADVEAYADDDGPDDA